MPSRKYKKHSDMILRSTVSHPIEGASFYVGYGAELLDSRLKGEAFRLLLLLRWRAGVGDSTAVSNKQLARDLNCSRESIIQWLGELEANGNITSAASKPGIPSLKVLNDPRDDYGDRISGSRNILRHENRTDEALAYFTFSASKRVGKARKITRRTDRSMVSAVGFAREIAKPNRDATTNFCDATPKICDGIAKIGFVTTKICDETDTRYISRSLEGINNYKREEADSKPAASSGFQDMTILDRTQIVKAKNTSQKIREDHGELEQERDFVEIQEEDPEENSADSTDARLSGVRAAMDEAKAKSKAKAQAAADKMRRKPQDARLLGDPGEMTPKALKPRKSKPAKSGGKWVVISPAEESWKNHIGEYFPSAVNPDWSYVQRAAAKEMADRFGDALVVSAIEYLFSNWTIVQQEVKWMTPRPEFPTFGVFKFLHESLVQRVAKQSSAASTSSPGTGWEW